jgi:hypothetical protein
MTVVHIEKGKMTSNLQSVCNSLQQNIKMWKLKRQIFCWRSRNSIKRKTTQDSQTHDIHYSEDKASYKAVALKYPYAVVVPWTLTCNPTRTLPNQVTYFNGSSMESFTLGPTPKIDFNFSTTTTLGNCLRVSGSAK